MAGLVGGNLARLAEPELAIALGRLAPERGPGGELAQEDPERRRLDLVEARVRPDVLEDALRPRSVEAQQADALGELRVVGRDEPAVPEPEQVLRRIEAEGRGDAGARDFRRAERLRGVLDQRHAERGELRERRPDGRRGAPG